MRRGSSITRCLWLAAAPTALIWICALPALAQQAPGHDIHPDYVLRQWTVEHGLPVNAVSGVARGADGYLWLTTFDGLVRFDGLRFTVYSSASHPDLPGNRLHGLTAGPDGSLWMLTETGEVIRVRDGRLTASEDHWELPGRVHTIVAEEGALWALGSDGAATLTEFDAAEPRFELFRPDVLPAGVQSMLRDRGGARWFGLPTGDIVRVTPGGGAERFTDQLPRSAVFELAEDGGGGIWAAYAHEGVRVWRGAGFEAIHATLRVRNLYTDGRGALWLRAPGSDGWWTFSEGALARAENMTAGRPGFLALDPGGRAWLTQGEWLYRDGTPIMRNPRASTHGDVATGALVQALAFDDDGGIWIGTDDRGLLHLRPRRLDVIGTERGLLSESVYPVFERARGDVWLGTWPRGFGLITDSSVTGLHFPEGPNYVTALHEDRAGTLWVGIYGGACRFEGTRCPPIEGLPSVGPVRAIHEDRSGTLWLGGEGGLVRWNRHDGARGFQILDGMPHRWIRAIVETRDGSLLFATGDGIARLLDDDTFEALSVADGLASGRLRDIHEDERGILWIATEDRGLCRVDRQGRRALSGADVTCLGGADGLPDHSLNRILEDDARRLWISSNRGIFWIVRDELDDFAAGRAPWVSAVTFNESHGMASRETNGGVQPAGIRARDGRLWFPTQRGVVVIDPARIDVPAAPPTLIEKVVIDGVALPSMEPFVLRGSRHDVEIAFTAPEFDHPADVLFRYRLEGYDATWRRAHDERTVHYSNLPPGRYTFRVEAGLGGAWSAAPAVLAIQRHPLFRETWWFRGLLAMGFVVLGALVYLGRVRRLEAYSRELETSVEDRTRELRQKNSRIEEQARRLLELDEAKNRFVANVSHELRTPLTLTFGPIDDILSGRLGSVDEARPHLERARRNGQRLLRLIEQLLDLSRLDAGVLRIDSRELDLAAFLRQRVAAFESLARSRGVELRFEADGEPFVHVFDPHHLETVVINLLSNAVKFTAGPGEIWVTLRREAGDAVIIEVRDTGEGIAPEHVPRLFDRFYQADASATRSREGAGIGLALSKQLVELHGGTIEVESEIGEGTTFRVMLPASPGEGRDASPGEGRDASPGAGRDASPRRPQGYVDATAASGRLGEPSLPEPPLPNLPLLLLVEDNADMRAYLATHLADDYAVSEAVDGAEGLERALELVPDLIVSDVMMPRMDGIELLEAVRADARTSHVPVLLLTARADVESRVAGIRSGADAYLAKPFDAAELEAQVAGLVDRQRRLRAHFGSVTLSPDQAGLPPMEVAFLEHVRRTVSERMSDPDFGVDALAEEVAMSRRQLLRKLDALTGETPADLIRRMRLERASELLAAGAMGAKEAAAAVGYRSASHFGQAFRAAYGVTPAEYTNGE